MFGALAKTAGPCAQISFHVESLDVEMRRSYEAI